MKKDRARLTIHNKHFICYKDETLNIDVLGGIDLTNIERMICTLRVTYGNYPPYRITLDLYADFQTEKLQRTLCEKWELKMLDVAKSTHRLILELENHRLSYLRYGVQAPHRFGINPEDKKRSLKMLKSKTLIKQLSQKLITTGIIGEDQNALILFIAMASHKYRNPFSVVCLAKSALSKSDLLQKLADCMPKDSHSYHTSISSNALYYMDSNEIHNKAIFIEDLDWTTEMLSPLVTLQSQGKLVKTRATKNKHGHLHSTTFTVEGKLCLLSCAYSNKNVESIPLPFLMLHLNQSQNQDKAIMDHQRKLKEGLIKMNEVRQTQKELQGLIMNLKNISIINPYATLIKLPEGIAHPRKSLFLLLNFIEVITYFFQYQREEVVDEETGEVFIKTHPDDIELAYKLLGSSLFKKADELSNSSRTFYNWLINFAKDFEGDQSFTGMDIRKVKAFHPRTLRRYLQELNLFNYVQIVGGNKHRGGFKYELTDMEIQKDTQEKIEKSLQENLKQIRNKYEISRTVGQNPTVRLMKPSTAKDDQ